MSEAHDPQHAPARKRNIRRSSQPPERASIEAAVREKIAAMPEPWRTIGERLDALIRSTAPELVPRLWYGMPAYAKAGKVVCFFRAPDRFDERYLTLGFTDAAQLDEGVMWPTSYALTDLTPSEEERIVALVRRAVAGG
ncbi:DUF1801 domain-containing protein [Thermomicrobium sp. CFH 73360]|uniref:iron chaperone n=1 Tax=Thermomicrobium sp. CFH 73360 TaxID=2951987 RepID=UPI002076E04C|nr:DUF1801 domain-containing protein [Thermomicrobium sp. CFH 73360]MCM8746280.1 DUF1801 domain-containing protein [Thermomicrobium sp. CFH 73360]